MKLKGDQPVDQRPHRWATPQVVADTVRRGMPRVHARRMPEASPIAEFARTTGVPPRRLLTIDIGDGSSRAEPVAFARAWSISAQDSVASLPGAVLLVA